MKTMAQMMLLSKEDLKGLEINTNQSRIDVLAQVCCVALDKFNRLKQQQHHHQKNIVLGFPQPQPQPQPIDIEGKHEKASNLKKTIKIVRNEKKEAADDQDQDQDQETHYHDHGLNLRRRTGSKRSRYDDDDYNDDDDDWEVNVEPKKKKKQLTSSKKSRRIVRSLNFERPAAPIDPNLIRDLPEVFRRRINGMQGTGIMLVMQKELTDTDLSPYHNRLLMPFTQIKNWDFLTQNEKADLRARGIMAVPLIEPEPVMKVTNMNLKQWDMAKPSGKASSCYVLRTAWKNVVKDNQLVPHEVAQVWSFRVQGRLHMALVVITRPPPPPPVQDAGVQLAMASTSAGDGGAGSSASGNSGSGSSQITRVAAIEAAPPAA